MNHDRPKVTPTLAPLVAVALALGSAAAATAVGPRDRPPVPDLTAGGTPLDDKTITLGPTGMRGWAWGWKGHTTLARQILVTDVAPGSPAAGRLARGDVIVGLAGEPFTGDARLALAKAITAAEAGDGKVRLLRWRQGQTADVGLELPVLGTYGPTAPYDCPKSEKILSAGCAAIAERGFRDGRGQIRVSIPNDLNALALLAGGDERYLPLVKEYAAAVAAHRPGSHVSWGYAYETLFLAEYVLATGDETVKPGLERLSLDIARGQSGVGTWGHAFARPEGNLNGYGCMNQPGIVLTLALVIAREAGVAAPEIDLAIARSERFLQWYIGKGAIPYGDHAPWPDHDDNGKCSSAAVLFDLLGRDAGASFFSRMATAAHAEREWGHTGNFFNVLWALPGVSRAGRDATGAYLAETAWYYDLARDHEGRFTHQGIPGEPDKDQYGGWDTTGAMLLAFALPERRLAITGRTPTTAARLTAAELTETIAAGPWNFWDGQETIYDPRTTAELMKGIASWSPAVRLRSAKALAKKANVPLQAIIARLGNQRPETRYGGCSALRFLGPRADAAAAKLRGLLRSADPWERVLAAEALVEMSDRVRAESLVPLLEVIVRRGDDPADPRRCSLGPLAEVLFKPGPGKREPRSILAGSLDLVAPPHRPLLVEAVRTVMHSEDGRIRSGAASLYGRLSPGELAELMPDILETIRTPAPSGEMFAYDIRMGGLELLAKLRIREGMELAVAIMNEKRWGRDFARAARTLETYGAAARHLLPELEGPTRTLVADEGKGRPEALEKTIRAIKADRGTRPVITAAEFVAAQRVPAAATAAPSSEPTHETRDALGWTLHVNRALLAADRTATERAVALLEKQLAEVVRVVPPAAVARLRETPLWFSPEYPGVGPKAEFHPDAGWLRNNGRDPAMARAIEFTNIRIFPQECERMPNFALHELAHAYHFRVLGFDDPAIKEAFERARAAGLYDKVEQHHGNGRPPTVGRAYAMTNEKEYFAEATEAYFSRNDFFPFTRAELAAHDPRMLRVLETAWGVAPAAATPASKPVRVYILAGQSNMEGHGEIAARPGRNGGRGSLEFLAGDAATAATFGPLRDASGTWLERSDVWIDYLDRSGRLGVGYGARPELIGPELGFGTVVGDAHDEPVLLVKCAWGGKSLAIDFRPPSAGRPEYPLGEKLAAEIAANPEILGRFYREMLALVKRARGRLAAGELVPEAAARGHVLAGFAWHQGWNDRIDDRLNAEYAANLAALIRDVRRDLDAPDLPFVIAETGMSGPEEKHPRALSLMEAQASVAKLPKFAGTVAFVPTREFWRPAAASPADQGYHWNRNAETYWLIGTGLGRAMLALEQQQAGK